MKPLFKWVGGKSRLLGEIHDLIPDADYTHYYEPFVGGGALFFNHGFKSQYSEISDVNARLVDCYAAIKTQPDKVCDEVWSLVGVDYYDLRAEFNAIHIRGKVRVAALLLGLMHLCFNGLYRTNKAGGFNTPIGRCSKGKPRDLLSFDHAAVHEASAYLHSTRIRCGSFVDTLSNIEVVPGKTLVFCDPPYLQEFSSYDSSGFGAKDHVTLALLASDLRDRGATVIVCGSDNAASHQIYGTPTRVVTLKRTVGAGERGDAREALYLFSP